MKESGEFLFYTGTRKIFTDELRDPTNGNTLELGRITRTTRPAVRKDHSPRSSNGKSWTFSLPGPITRLPLYEDGLAGISDRKQSIWFCLMERGCLLRERILETRNTKLNEKKTGCLNCECLGKLGCGCRDDDAVERSMFRQARAPVSDVEGDVGISELA